VFCGACWRRNIPDGLRLVEYATENRKSWEYINRLLEKYIREKKESEQTKKQRKKKEE
jgi:hypothetical protein